MNDSKIIKGHGYRWEQVPRREYKKRGDSSFEGITRQTLLGAEDGENPLNIELRYFEIEPGGCSSLERHEHTHSVVVLRGKGCVILGDEVRDIEPPDCVYVSPGTLHQFHAASDSCLGFLCVVDRSRDRPQPPHPAELAALREDPILGKVVKA